MTGPVLNTADAAGFPFAPEAGSVRFGATIGPIGETLGLTQLGAMFIQVEPGKRAFPFHNHLANDEMFVILEGEGTYRFGDEEHAVKAGDICAAPRGGPDTAHQLINTGSAPLNYLGISTRKDPEVVEYPDSGKFATLAIAPGASFMEAHLRFIGRASETLGYWDDEET